MALKVLQNITKLDDNALSRLFINAQKLLEKNDENFDARQVIDAIKSEWETRLQLFKQNKYKATTPENGLLSVVGYKVGNEGEKTSIRRKLLDFIMSENLPPVGSPAYLAEWGEKMSKDRYRKLHRVIRVLASSSKTKGNRDKAVIEWEEDLEYLENNWKFKV